MNDAMTIKSNHQERELFSFEDLPANKKENFDYIQGEDRFSLRLFSYRGSWYDYYEFDRAGDDLKAKGWDGVQTESYFSAVLVTYWDRDGNNLEDSIIVGYCHW